MSIILTDDTGGLPTTFSDDSFEDVRDAYAPVVVARIPSGADLRWHQDVVQRLARRSREVKASLVLNHWRDLPVDLQQSMMRTIRDACISILDPRAYTFAFERMIGDVVKNAGEVMRSRLRKQFLARYVTERVLWDSPAWRVQAMLFPDPPFGLSQIYGVSSGYRYDDSLFDALRKKLQKPHTVRLFGARSAAAFAELLDEDERATSIEAMVDQRYFVGNDITLSVFARHRSTRHVFDEGNASSVQAIELLRTTADRAVQRRDRFMLVLPDDSGVSEASSKETRELQAADIAAGYARRLYESNEGLKKVCVEFRQVLLNGEIIKDGVPRL